jgi:hypothetical protein
MCLTNLLQGISGVDGNLGRAEILQGGGLAIVDPGNGRLLSAGQSASSDGVGDLQTCRSLVSWSGIWISRGTDEGVGEGLSGDGENDEGLGEHV